MFHVYRKEPCSSIDLLARKNHKIVGNSFMDMKMRKFLNKRSQQVPKTIIFKNSCYSIRISKHHQVNQSFD